MPSINLPPDVGFNLPDGRHLTIEEYRFTKTYAGVLEGGTTPETIAQLVEMHVKDATKGWRSAHLIPPTVIPLQYRTRDGAQRYRLPWFACTLDLMSGRVYHSPDSRLLVVFFLDDNPFDVNRIEAALAGLDWDAHAQPYDIEDDYL